MLSPILCRAVLAIALIILSVPQALAQDMVTSDDIVRQLEKKPQPPGGASRSFRGVRISTTPESAAQPAGQSFGQPAGQAGQQAQPPTRDAAAPATPAAKPQATVYLYFKSGSAELADEFSARQLAAVGKALAALPGAHFEIGGHTDSIGSDEANQSLSERRAQAVRTRLIESYGLKPESVAARGYGESQPLADNGTEAGRAKNRRVVITRLD
ncbi:Outer membrane protein OmpA [Humidesulfovibrio mexicanus]|jgi:OOP family OmpA-OmpF porin|uniref:Outer membrane protein OmpA n=1 Tax=Humidesulfovibrio mexicanus TaxID=147047 RepID=A0A238Y7F3_9BACT|nr:OmpA family protein [Humidesulfovibrio mexicanus]SNR66524.1 Outer membrane protein OmpA [Humidesulfovibrio mexicanus]